MSFWNAIGAGISGAFGIGGSVMNSIGADKDRALSAQQYDHQKEFAQNSIQWRVNDAKKAGIHPLYALGSQGISYAPSSFSSMPDTSLSDAGNAIGTAVAGMAGQKQAKELHDLQKASLVEDVRAKRLANEMSSKQLMSMGQSGASHSTLLQTSLAGQSTPVTQSGATNTTNKGLVGGVDLSKVVPNVTFTETARGELVPYPAGDVAGESYSEGNFNKALWEAQLFRDGDSYADSLNNAHRRAGSPLRYRKEFDYLRGYIYVPYIDETEFRDLSYKGGK